MTSPDGPVGLDLLFAPGAPSAGIGTLGVERSTVTWTGSTDPEVVQDLEWEIQYVVQRRVNTETGKDPISVLVVFGDLRVLEDGWFVAATARADIYFRDGLVDLDSEIARAYAGWASLPLYDTCLGEARRLAAGVSVGRDCSITLPPHAPSPVISPLLDTEH